MKAGIVGLPNVGKSTLFNCLSNAKVQSANFPFCTIEPNLGTVNVPDKRLETLAKIVSPENTIPATVEIVDIAGLVKGASKGEGLGNQFLANIRECNAIIHVIRCFDDNNIIHVDGAINPLNDKEVIDTELQLKDLDFVEKRFEKVWRTAKSGDKSAQQELDILTKIRQHLDSGNSVRTMFGNVDEKTIGLINTFHLLTAKPVIYLCNVDEASISRGNSYVDLVKKEVEKENAQLLVLSAAVESEISELESSEEQLLFLSDLGIEEPGVARLIRATYKALDLQTYFTAGKKEVRAWTIPVGSYAPKAASVIHTDFEKGFIRAEVIGYQDYLHFKSEAKVKQAGKMRIEGKDYIIKDGDIVHFRFNV
ncbi:ribosome-binding ATPase YchF [Elysia marginata]|uniref:Obg-like ATPase 1 n=1 Tax=Elysia marginata TaxID=1093978 RepID=A0AAV4G680_9GAST|nr:ribosome-binding ATPase YchF [Elysia marginata]